MDRADAFIRELIIEISAVNSHSYAPATGYVSTFLQTANHDQ
jgi:hypothetical protein